MSKNIFRLTNIGHCYICGKPISPDELYVEMEDSDTIFCEKCWKEYAKRNDALIEQMKTEKRNPLSTCLWGLEPKDRHCEFCSAVCSARPFEQGSSSALILPLTIKTTIEKGSDGMYCVYSDCKIGNSYLGGYGATKKKAIEDFKGSIKEAMLENVEIEYNEN